MAADDSNKCVKLVGEMPDLNKRIIAYIIRLLQTISSAEHVCNTHMSPESLAAVLVPSFLRCPTDNATDMLKYSAQEQAFLKNLILYMHVPDFLPA
jgi:hypothetical protein